MQPANTTLAPTDQDDQRSVPCLPVNESEPAAASGAARPPTADAAEESVREEAGYGYGV